MKLKVVATLHEERPSGSFFQQHGFASLFVSYFGNSCNILSTAIIIITMIMLTCDQWYLMLKLWFLCLLNRNHIWWKPCMMCSEYSLELPFLLLLRFSYSYSLRHKNMKIRPINNYNSLYVFKLKEESHISMLNKLVMIKHCEENIKQSMQKWQ